MISLKHVDNSVHALTSRAKQNNLYLKWSKHEKEDEILHAWFVNYTFHA